MQRAEFDDHRDELLVAAAGEGVDAFARWGRELARRIVANSRTGSDADELDAQRTASKVKRWVDKISGMSHTHLELDPVRDATLWGIMDVYTSRLRNVDGNAGTAWSQLQVNAFVEAVVGDGYFDHDDADTDDVMADVPAGGSVRPGHRAGRGRLPRVPEVLVLVELDVLKHGLHEGAICETDNGVPLPVSTVRRMCCDAEVVPVVLGGDGEVLDVGRAERTATRSQRRARRVMHRSCAHPDCSVVLGVWDPSRQMVVGTRRADRHRQSAAVVRAAPSPPARGRLGPHDDPDRDVTWARPDGVVYWTGASIDRTITTRVAA